MVWCGAHCWDCNQQIQTRIKSMSVSHLSLWKFDLISPITLGIMSYNGWFWLLGLYRCRLNPFPHHTTKTFKQNFVSLAAVLQKLSKQFKEVMISCWLDQGPFSASMLENPNTASLVVCWSLKLSFCLKTKWDRCISWLMVLIVIKPSTNKLNWRVLMQGILYVSHNAVFWLLTIVCWTQLIRKLVTHPVTLESRCCSRRNRYSYLIMLNSEEKSRNKHLAELEDAMSIKIVIVVV